MVIPRIIDWDELLSLRELQVPDEPDVVADVIQMFMEDSHTRLVSATAALQARDADTLRLEAHALRGSAGLIGAGSLQATAQAVESAVPGADWPAIEIAFGLIVVAIGDVRAELADFASANDIAIGGPSARLTP